jgi:hypothetical protein
VVGIAFQGAGFVPRRLSRRRALPGPVGPG